MFQKIKNYIDSFAWKVFVSILLIIIIGWGIGWQVEKLNSIPATEIKTDAQIDADFRTDAQIVSDTTVLFPSYLTYDQMRKITKGTGLESIDFIYAEKNTGIDALTLIAIAAHESAWGSNYWAKTYNNVMSWGVSDTNPDRTYYKTKLENVIYTGKELNKLYLSETGVFYHGCTLWDICVHYCPTKDSTGKLTYSWAKGVTDLRTELENKYLTEPQRVKRWAVKTGLISPPYDWTQNKLDIIYILYKVNLNKVTLGR